MTDPLVTIVLSDLHVGGGPSDPGDDHIYQGDQLRRFIEQQAATPEGLNGQIEIFFNGDFLEFAQTNQAAYAHLSDDLWCSEVESLAKLETILTGHADIFEALRKFQAAGNVVTIAAGNHDVDLAWPKIQAKLREAVGTNTRFEIGREWIERYGGKLQVGHGHQQDEANKFKHWSDPIRNGDWGLPRLEMCPGTLFMVKFVNRLEAKYPFADNLLPVTKLLPVLMSDDKAGLAGVAWLFSRLLFSTSFSTLRAGAIDDIDAQLLQQLRDDPARRDAISVALKVAGLKSLHTRWTEGAMKTRILEEVMLGLLGRIDDTAWLTLFKVPDGASVLSTAGSEVTLNALRKAAYVDGKAELRVAARERAAETGAQVMICGHTHQQDERHEEGFSYFNPGSWTRYLELGAEQKVTLEDLKDESRYPYALNYVRIAAGCGDRLEAGMVCFERYTVQPD